MEKQQKTILAKIQIAINILYDKDSYLLEQDLSERSITHKFAEYLQILFPQYDIDCEYNGNIDEAKGKKRIIALKAQLEAKNLLTKEEIKGDSELVDRRVYPDIIIHRRGTDDNLCIIEIKKSTSQISSEYDEIKLEAYTSDIYGNNLKYKIGFFIEFTTKSKEKQHKIKFFIDGKCNLPDNSLTI